MGKIVNKATAEKVGKNFLESVKPVRPDLKQRALKSDVQVKKLELVHQGSSLRKFAKRSKTQARAKLLTLQKDEDPCFYVFNSSGKEFVIVAADESMEPIIGYSDESNFDETNMPPAMVDYLEDMRLKILQIRKNKAGASKKVTSRWGEFKKGNKNKNEETKDSDGSPGGGSGSGASSSVKPLVKTKWHQWPLYNNLCPAGCPTGCVATAMAQVMNYNGFPNTGTGSHTSSEAENGVRPTANFGETTYRWDLMPQRLTSDSTTEEIDAVATLMRHCGISVNMNYAPGGSGAATADVKDALKDHFKYDSNIKIYDNTPNSSNWTNLLKTEISNKMPVVYRGGSPNGGHAFVCDGYDNNGLFHFNWGWNGSSDGYFLLTDLLGFTQGNFFIYNIKPNETRYFMNVSTSHNTDDEPNPIIFPYGDVSAVKGYTKTFVISESDNYTFEHVTVNGVIKNTTPYGSKKKIAVAAAANVKIVAQLRHKKDFESNGIMYHPLSPDYKKVQVMPPSVAYSGNIVIPDSIKDTGQAMYDAIGIKDNAFYNQKQLLSIRLGEGVKDIGKSAFSGCAKLKFVSINASNIGDSAFEGCTCIKKITSYSAQPPSCGKDVFKGLSLKNIKLYVYENCVSAYRSANVWKDFYIVPMSKQSMTYYVATRTDTNGEHEVHKSYCTHKSPAPWRLIDLGKFNNTGKAVLAALEHYGKTDGCYYCCREEHTT